MPATRSNHYSYSTGGEYQHFQRRLARRQPYDAGIGIISSATRTKHLPAAITDILSSSFLKQALEIADEATSSETKRKDRSRIEQFKAWCVKQGIRQEDVFPAPETVILAWAASFAGRVAGKTVGAKILALEKLHQREGWAWRRGPLLKEVIKGVENTRPASSFRQKRPPVTIDMLEQLDSGLSHVNGLDVSVRNLSFVLFFGQGRTGEFTPPSEDIRKFNPSRYPTFRNLQKSTARNGATNLHLPWSKTEKARGDNIWLARQSRFDSINELRHHYKTNNLSPDSPIASYRDENGTLKALTKAKFIRRVNEILKPKGFPRITGHCFRIGGTTFYLISQVPPDIVKKFGRWRSSAFLIYWRCLDYLGEAYLDNLPIKKVLRKRRARCMPQA